MQTIKTTLTMLYKTITRQALLISVARFITSFHYTLALKSLIFICYNHIKTYLNYTFYYKKSVYIFLFKVSTYIISLLKNELFVCDTTRVLLICALIYFFPAHNSIIVFTEQCLLSFHSLYAAMPYMTYMVWIICTILFISSIFTTYLILISKPDDKCESDFGSFVINIIVSMLCNFTMFITTFFLALSLSILIRSYVFYELGINRDFSIESLLFTIYLVYSTWFPIAYITRVISNIIPFYGCIPIQEMLLEGYIDLGLNKQWCNSVFNVKKAILMVTFCTTGFVVKHYIPVCIDYVSSNKLKIISTITFTSFISITSLLLIKKIFAYKSYVSELFYLLNCDVPRPYGFVSSPIQSILIGKSFFIAMGFGYLFVDSASSIGTNSSVVTSLNETMHSACPIGADYIFGEKYNPANLTHFMKRNNLSVEYMMMVSSTKQILSLGYPDGDLIVIYNDLMKMVMDTTYASKLKYQSHISSLSSQLNASAALATSAEVTKTIISTTTLISMANPSATSFGNPKPTNPCINPLIPTDLKCSKSKNWGMLGATVTMDILDTMKPCRVFRGRLLNIPYHICDKSVIVSSFILDIYIGTLPTVCSFEGATLKGVMVGSGILFVPSVIISSTSSSSKVVTFTTHTMAISGGTLLSKYIPKFYETFAAEKKAQLSKIK